MPDRKKLLNLRLSLSYENETTQGHPIHLLIEYDVWFILGLTMSLVQSFFSS